MVIIEEILNKFENLEIIGLVYLVKISRGSVLTPCLVYLARYLTRSRGNEVRGNTAAQRLRKKWEPLWEPLHGSVRNFWLHRYFETKFSAAPLFWNKIFVYAAILEQNFWLHRYFGTKFSAAPLLCNKIFGGTAILDQNFRLRRYYGLNFELSKMEPHEFKMP